MTSTSARNSSRSRSATSRRALRAGVVAATIATMLAMLALLGMAPSSAQEDSSPEGGSDSTSEGTPAPVDVESPDPEAPPAEPEAVTTGDVDAASAEDPKDLVVLTGRVSVAAFEEFGAVAILNGPATIDGTTTGNVIVVNGETTVSGRVGGDLVVLNGDVSLRPGAVVDGDVVSRSTPDVAAGAQVRGEVRDVDVFWTATQLSWVQVFLIWAAFSISLLVLGLLFLLFAPRGADAVAEAGHKKILGSIFVGILVAIALPAMAVGAIVTVFGIPFGVAVLGSLFLVYSAGYLATSWIIGRRIMRRPGHHLLPFLLGFVIMRGLGLIPGLDLILVPAAAVFGLGAMTIAVWRARKSRRRARDLRDEAMAPESMRELDSEEMAPDVQATRPDLAPIDMSGPIEVVPTGGNGNGNGASTSSSRPSTLTAKREDESDVEFTPDDIEFDTGDDSDYQPPD